MATLGQIRFFQDATGPARTYWVTTMPLSDTPAVFERWYLLGKACDWHDCEEGRLASYVGGSNQLMLHGTFPRKVWFDGSADCTRTVEIPVECPRVRRGTETRWNGLDGRWEKLSKREGWIPA